MPRTYDPEFRRRVVELVRAGRPVRVVAAELGLAEATVYRWKAQDLIDRGVKPGPSTSEQGELAAARRRIKELETELALVTQAAALFEEGVRPKAKYPVIAELARQGFSAKRCCRILGVAASGFFMWRRRVALATPAPVRLADRAGASHPRRLSWHLRMAAGQRRAALRPRRDRQPQDGPQDHAGPGPARPARSRGRASGSKANMATTADLVERRFDRPAPDQLWVTDITEHPTREGKVYCCVVLDVFSRRVVGWSIDSHQATAAGHQRPRHGHQPSQPTTGQTVIHSDHGSQFTSWAFTQRAKDSGLLPSMGTIGDAYDNAVIESFWAPHADRAARPPAVEDPCRAGQRDLRVPGDLPQPATTPQCPGLAHPGRV